MACPVQSAPACKKSWLVSSATTSPLPPYQIPRGSHIAVVQLSSVASSSCRLRFRSQTCTTSLLSTPLFNGVLGVDIVFGHLNNQEKNWTNDEQLAESTYRMNITSKPSPRTPANVRFEACGGGLGGGSRKLGTILGKTPGSISENGGDLYCVGSSLV